MTTQKPILKLNDNLRRFFAFLESRPTLVCALRQFSLHPDYVPLYFEYVEEKRAIPKWLRDK